MLQQQAIVLQDPSIPLVSKNIFKRKLYELQGLSAELIQIFVPLSPDERRAFSYLEIINNDIVPESLFVPNMDLFTYWVYLNRAEDTDAKQKVL
jgi:hypothetical protein